MFYAETTSRGFQILFGNLPKASHLLQNDFEVLGQVKANRVQSEQLNIRHKKSGIQCTLQFTTELAIVHAEQAKKIILDYFSLDPLCK